LRVKFKIKTTFIKDASIEIYRYAQDLRIPFLLIHGDRDQSCLVEHSLKFFQAVRSPKVIHILEGAEHMFPKQKERLRVFNITSNWFMHSL
jgi:dipeptidyl aminopeptidase/acylaminoacyl peptidase